RVIPKGYKETVRSGEDRFEDPAIAELWEAVELVATGPLFTRERWKAIWKLQRRDYAVLRDATRYRYPSTVEVTGDQIVSETRMGKPFAADGTLALGPSGALVSYAEPQHAREIRLQVPRELSVELHFMRGGDVVGRRWTELGGGGREELGSHTVPVPKSAWSEGYDAIRVMPSWGSKPWKVGSLEVMESR
ncbi:MAG: hypothetical protein JRJ84_13440, partial [Deltaproteobacteria bacterium]|nr:hypothetical protein [Deltaproteobacteria bacterium]